MSDNKPQWMHDHEQSDLMQFQSIHEAIGSLPTRSDIEKLATKEDVAAVLTFFSSMQLAAKILSGGGKWTWRALVALAAFITVIGILTGGLKGAVLAIMAWSNINR